MPLSLSRLRQALPLSSIVVSVFIGTLVLSLRNGTLTAQTGGSTSSYAQSVSSTQDNSSGAALSSAPTTSGSFLFGVTGLFGSVPVQSSNSSQQSSGSGFVILPVTEVPPQVTSSSIASSESSSMQTSSGSGAAVSSASSQGVSSSAVSSVSSLGASSVAASSRAAVSPAKSAVMLTTRPHCTKANQRTCPLFSVVSPLNIQTQVLTVGETLDLDLLLQNTGKLPLQHGRVWLSYDPTILEGISITPNEFFPVPTPGQMVFDAEKGYAKVEVQTSVGVSTGALIPLAQVTFKVRSSPTGGSSIISFYDAEGSEPHTAIYTNDTPPKNVLSARLGSLSVRVEVVEDAPPPAEVGVVESSSSSAVSSASSASKSSAEHPAAHSSSSALAEKETKQSSSTSSQAQADEVTSPLDEEVLHNSAFVLLQIQNLRVTTEDTSLYVAWDSLAAPGLLGYNVYYGTQTGRYIQRRSIDATEHTITIRSLPKGTRYYVAIRGINEQNEETAFSHEVAVTIGDPATSTAPLREEEISTGKNLVKEHGGTGNVPGESGLPSTAVLLVVASAVIGTLFAFRRQTFAISSTQP